jgi:epoxyqueuosine reductase
MLINSRRGSWFFIGLLLTTVDFQPDQPALGGCGTCRACIDACPTGAIVFEDQRWQLDARSCISYLTIETAGELGREVGEWTFGCDVCQEVCPFNEQRETQPQRGAWTSEPDFLARRQWPSLPKLADLRYEEWDELTRGSAVRRAGFDGLRRNARANLKQL